MGTENNKKEKSEKKKTKSGKDTDEAACCLCHCSLDYSDRAAFFVKDREKEAKEWEEDNKNDDDNQSSSSTSSSVASYCYKLDDPYLPSSLYDKHNALVYCDSCDRLYHQKCHFVPIFTLPRGKWYCLICTYVNDSKNNKSKKNAKKNSKQKATKSKSKTKTKKNSNVKEEVLSTVETTFTKKQLEEMFQSPPRHHLMLSTNVADAPDAATAGTPKDDGDSNHLTSKNKNFYRKDKDIVFHSELEKQWEYVSRHNKAELWYKQLSSNSRHSSSTSNSNGNSNKEKKLPQIVQSQIGNLRATQNAFETFVRSRQNRQYYMNVGSQELAQTLVKHAASKEKLRSFCQFLESIRVHKDQYEQWQILQHFIIQNMSNDNNTNNSSRANNENESKNSLFIKRILFPFGVNFPRRIVPTTPEGMKNIISPLPLPLTATATITKTETIKDPKATPIKYDNHKEKKSEMNRNKKSIVEDVEIPTEITTTTFINNSGKKKQQTLKKRTKQINKNEGGGRGKSNSHSDNEDEDDDQVENNKNNNNNSKKNNDEDKVVTSNHDNGSAAGDSSSSSSSGVSLDDLKCSICFIGDSTDENDLLMCDGQGCYRCYHMQCIKPAVTQEEIENEDDHWFCPICSSIANILHTIQVEYYGGDEWEQRRLERIKKQVKKSKNSDDTDNDNKNSKRICSMKTNNVQLHRKDSNLDDGYNSENERTKDSATDSPQRNVDDEDDDDDDSSLRSWEHADDVFPESVWELEAAIKFKSGERNEDTKKLLAQVLGMEEDDGNYDEEEDDDDPEEDGDFDLDSYQEMRQELYKNMAENTGDGSDQDSDTTHSSQVTLVGMSSVEYSVDRSELEAICTSSIGSYDSDSLSDSEGQTSGDDDDNNDDDQQETKRQSTRRSRRLRARASPADKASNEKNDDTAGLIIEGKRKRKPVDYRRLNDALFGEMEEEELALIDDKEDEFRLGKKKKNSNNRKKKIHKKRSTKTNSISPGDRKKENEGSDDDTENDASSSNDVEENGDDDMKSREDNENEDNENVTKPVNRKVTEKKVANKKVVSEKGGEKAENKNDQRENNKKEHRKKNDIKQDSKKETERISSSTKSKNNSIGKLDKVEKKNDTPRKKLTKKRKETSKSDNTRKRKRSSDTSDDKEDKKKKNKKTIVSPKSSAKNGGRGSPRKR